MTREHCKKYLKTGGKVALLVAVIAIPAYAITRTSWVHPCTDSNDLTCDGGCPICFPPILPTCVCDGDFDNDVH